MITINLRKRIAENLFGKKVSNFTDQIEQFLKPKDKIIDLGAGTCLFTKALIDKGFDIKPVDIKNRSYYSDVEVHLYDGKHLPYKDNGFDVCLLRSVLHHTINPETVLIEAARVSKKLIIHENVVTNIFQRYYTYLIDVIMNKELIQPHTNKTDRQWKSLFKKLKLDLTNTIDETVWLFLHNKIYFLNKQ